MILNAVVESIRLEGRSAAKIKLPTASDDTKGTCGATSTGGLKDSPALAMADVRRGPFYPNTEGRNLRAAGTGAPRYERDYVIRISLGRHGYA